jgi:hypothetical protein
MHPHPLAFRHFARIARGWGVGVQVQVQVAWCKYFFGIQFKNTYNLIFLGLKVPSERFFHKDFKTGLTFLNMWF